MIPSRVLGVALALVAALSGGSVATGAEPPTLGGRLSPVPMTFERDPRLNVTNLSTVPVRASIEVEGPGWVLEADAFELAIGERRTIAVVAAGEDEAAVSVLLVPIIPAAGTDVNALVLQGRLRHAGPWEDLPLVPILLLALLAGLALLWAVRRRILTQAGQGLAEYALILALIAVVAIIALVFLGTQVSTILSDVANSV